MSLDRKTDVYRILTVRLSMQILRNTADLDFYTIKLKSTEGPNGLFVAALEFVLFK